MIKKYIKKIDDYSYEIAPKSLPFMKHIEIYRGDEISISLKGIHLSDNKDPFNWNAFDSFKAQFRLFPESTISFDATSDNFLLGQSEEAIAYDIEEVNPTGTTKDELHFLDPSYEILKEYKLDRAELDIQAEVNDSIYTIIRFKINIKNDITR